MLMLQSPNFNKIPIRTKARFGVHKDGHFKGGLERTEQCFERGMSSPAENVMSSLYLARLQFPTTIVFSFNTSFRVY
jgi:hypothetical protein